MLMEALRQPVMTVAASSTLVNCLQKAALGKQQSGSLSLEGHEAEVLQLLRAIAAQYATHGSLQCARSVWHGEHTNQYFTEFKSSFDKADRSCSTAASNHTR